jgi:hypothetical protein
MTEEMKTRAESGSEQVATAPGDRKSYETPKLRRLGAVHELTLGGAMTVPELPAGFKAM